MANETKFRVKAGELLFEIEGTEEFVQRQMAKHSERIDMILEEQAKLVTTGKTTTQRRGRGRRRRATTKGAGRRPGRQPVIIRTSDLELKPRKRQQLQKYLQEVAGEGKLGKDATVFAIAYFLCTEVLKRDKFTAGDVSVAFKQIAPQPYLPDFNSVDVVQMLRNLAAESIGKEWVVRNADGTFELSAKGKSVGESGQIVRPRGRRPSGRAKATVKKAKRGPGRPRKKASAKKAAPKKSAKKRRRGRPKKTAS